MLQENLHIYRFKKKHFEGIERNEFFRTYIFASHQCCGGIRRGPLAVADPADDGGGPGAWDQGTGWGGGSRGNEAAGQTHSGDQGSDPRSLTPPPLLESGGGGLVGGLQVTML